LSAQAVTVRAENGALQVRAGAFSFIKGQPLARLKDGRSVRFEFTLEVFAQPGSPPVAESRASFVLSYDLWEERFAVAQAGPPSRSASHLAARDAEIWCLDRVTVPLASLGRLGHDAPLWVRLAYRVAGDADTATTDNGLTLRGLIDRLSRRAGADFSDAIEAGPLMLLN
jgi:hypothetical protein